MADIVLINPRFDVSYWGLEYAMPLLGKGANMPVAGLPLLAALTPCEHRVTLLDENIAPLDLDRIARADIVGLTGMSVQRFRMRDMLRSLKAQGAFTVVGGPWVSVSEAYFGELADVIFVGEAEETWPLFLQEWAAGRPVKRYEHSQKTDMTLLPCPRYDLVEFDRYMFASLQISRGCPFECEFCDIIVTFGRRPRLKTGAQVIAELEALRAQKMQIAFIVDDNLIANRRAIGGVLRDIARWQKQNGYPFIFFTEASLDLADDAALLRLMVEANIQCVFIGVETVNEDSLREAKKPQNLRSSGSLAEKVRRIQQAGLEVWTGMIVGFDHDDESIFDAQVRFLEEARVAHAMFGMLTAIPKTPLYDRLRDDHRLDFEEPPAWGTNVVPLKMTREALRDGYVSTMQRLSDADAYFDRIDSLYHDLSFQFNRAQRAAWRRHPLRWLRDQCRSLIHSAVLFCRLMKEVQDRDLREIYRSRLVAVWRRRHEPAALFNYLIKCAMHYHYHRMVQDMTNTSKPLVNTF